MIIPFLDGLLTFSRAPITWLIILLNVFLFSQNYGLSQECQEQFGAWYEDSDFLYTQGQVYKQFSKEREIASVSDMTLLGRLAFRDDQFLQQASAGRWTGDPVALRSWKEDLSLFNSLRGYYPPALLGVSSDQQDAFAFVSYQFFHEGFLHLFGNVLLVLLIGGYLERRYSGSLVFAVYLLGGVLSAYLYTQINGVSGAPLIGASGSLCSLLGFMWVMEFEKKTRLFYILLPRSDYMGFVSVATCYWVPWLFVLEDIAGWLSQPDAYASGVAHLVHIYGFAVGILLAFVAKNSPIFLRRHIQRPVDEVV